MNQENSLKGNSTHIHSLSTCQESKQSFRLAMYISDHGFGHASRNIPIIRYILEANKDIRVIIKTGKSQGEFIKSLIGDFRGRVRYYFDSMDIGLVLKEGTLDIDKDSLTKKVKEYIKTFGERVNKENNFLVNNNVDLIISDIVPWVFKSAKNLDIPSILISNFTWVDIYKEYLSEDIYSEYIKCYELADKALFYELYMDEMKSYIKNYEEVSLCSRIFNLEKADKIKRSFKRQIVYLSVGRSVNLKEEIDVSNLNYDFIVTDGIKLKGNNVYSLPKETSNTQDYLMVSDFVITKAGWGTVSEALLAKKKIAVLSRDNVAEDRNTINKLKNRDLSIEVNYDNDFDLNNILNNLKKFNPRFDKYKFKNDYKKIGDKLISYLKENR